MINRAGNRPADQGTGLDGYQANLILNGRFHKEEKKMATKEAKAKAKTAAKAQEKTFSRLAAL
jgi:hypothetical protein